MSNDIFLVIPTDNTLSSVSSCLFARVWFHCCLPSIMRLKKRRFILFNYLQSYCATNSYEILCYFLITMRISCRWSTSFGPGVFLDEVPQLHSSPPKVKVLPRHNILIWIHHVNTPLACLEKMYNKCCVNQLYIMYFWSEYMGALNEKP